MEHRYVLDRHDIRTLSDILKQVRWVQEDNIPNVSNKLPACTDGIKNLVNKLLDNHLNYVTLRWNDNDCS